MKTIKFFSSMGVTPGFYHQNEGWNIGEKSEQVIASLWQKHAFAIYAETGIYVSALITPAIVVYNENWGCPLGGEYIVSITGEYNPKFATCNPEIYKVQVRCLLYRLAKELKQESTQVTFQEMEFDYIDLRKK